MDTNSVKAETVCRIKIVSGERFTNGITLSRCFENFRKGNFELENWFRGDPHAKSSNKVLCCKQAHFKVLGLSM